MAILDVNYDTLIPNNVGLSQDRKVLKALEMCLIFLLQRILKLLTKVLKYLLSYQNLKKN